MVRSMKKKIMIFAIFTILFISIMSFYFLFLKKEKETKYELLLIENLNVEINSNIKVDYFIKSIKNGTIKNIDDIVSTATLGENNITLKIINNLNIIKEKSIKYNVIDTQKPIIENVKDKKIIVNNSIDLLNNIIVKDNSNEIIKPSLVGNYDFNKAGKYSLSIIATDSSNNSTTENFTLTVEKMRETKSIINKKPYYIKINRTQNVVMIYGLDDNNEYTKLIKVFVCSTGKATPVGTFNTTDKYIWRLLVGNVYGQYATRITGHILFHSVPYFTQNKNDLEYEEYNKLGTSASLGCIRLSVVDTKWIYDNCPKGTTVEIYDGELDNGITKPSVITIDVNNANKGWDPTDPDEANPWNN